MKYFILPFAALAALASTPALADGHGHSAHAAQTTNIVGAAVATPSLSTLVAAVKAAGLVETLSGPGPFTVFAPTNDAFAKLPAGTVDTLLKPENKSALTGVLTYHAVAGSFDSKAITRLVRQGRGVATVTTVQGQTLTVRRAGKTLSITDAKGGVARVALANLRQSNGIVHVIDSVLLP